MHHIVIQPNDFDLGDEYAYLRQQAPDAGAIVTFTGLVRDFESQPNNKIDSLSLQHYPKMTEKQLGQILDEAALRWPLLRTSVIHRVGVLKPTEQIVFIGVAANHRAPAFHAAEFIMDYLKTRAAFWKSVQQNGNTNWVEQKASDRQAEQRW